MKTLFLAFQWRRLLGLAIWTWMSVCGILAQDTLSVQPAETVWVNVPAPADALDELDYMETGVHRFSLRSPYHAVLSHLYFLQEKTWHPDSAAMTLNLSDYAAPQSQEKAIKLKQFLDGSGYFIDIDALPKDADYTDTTNGLHRFRLIAAVPEIFLYKKERGWVYSRTTVEAIDALHARIFPFGTMKWLPEWSQGRFLGLQLWQYLGLLLFLTFTYLFHKLLTKLIGRLLEFILQRFLNRPKAVEFFTKVARPISLLILFIVLDKLFPALQFSSDVNRWVVNGFKIMIPVYGMMIGVQVVNLLMAYLERRTSATKTKLDDQLLPVLRNVLKGFVVVFALIYILDRLSVDITALVGGVAFGTLAFALAAQDTIRNLFGSVLIFLDKPFQIGDWVVIGDNEGVVEEVSVRSTRIRTFANSLISIPNGTIAAAAINNMGARVYRRFVTRVGLHYGTPAGLIEVFVEGVRELIRNHPDTKKDGYEVHFDTMTDSSLQVLIYVFFTVPSWTRELESRQSLLLSVIELQHRLGLGFAFPKPTLPQPSAQPATEEGGQQPMDTAAAWAVMRGFVAEIKAQRLQSMTNEGAELTAPEAEEAAQQGHS